MPEANYVCRCGQRISIKSQDIVRCHRCEGRILYKIATNATRKYSAR